MEKILKPSKIGMMRMVYNQRKNLLWSTILLSIILTENIGFVKGYPMVVEVEENSERVSDFFTGLSMGLDITLTAGSS